MPMRRLCIALVCILTGACAPLGRRNINAALLPYVNSFELILGHSIDFPVQFGDLSSITPSAPGNHVVGLCSADASGVNVTIDANAWTGFDDTIREILVYHELGHCELYRVHTSALNSDSQPVSIMNPIVNSIAESYYTAHRQEYVQELFNNRGH